MESTAAPKRFDVCCMCNALFDLQAEVDDEMVANLSLTKGGMFLLSHEQQRAIVPQVYQSVVNTGAGGSGANTAIGIALLGGTACFTSRVGDDEHGRLYRDGLIAKGVQPNLGAGVGQDANTGISLILVTPDAQRTMCTYLGQSQELVEQDIAAADIEASRYLYVTGYLWDTPGQKAAVLHAMRIARDAGVPIALSLSDTFCIARHRDDFLDLLRDYVDVVFANADEAIALTGASTYEEAIVQLSPLMKPTGARLSAVTRDREGSVIHDGVADRQWHIPAYPVTAIDSTGAGDMFAAGLLYGLTQNLPLDASGRIASYAAAQTVARMGPRLESIDPEAITALRNGLPIKA